MFCDCFPRLPDHPYFFVEVEAQLSARREKRPHFLERRPGDRRAKHPLSLSLQAPAALSIVLSKWQVGLLSHATRAAWFSRICQACPVDRLGLCLVLAHGASVTAL
eukprot:scaffold58991_cov27-Tisochrysis_lutea.AAC.6